MVHIYIHTHTHTHTHIYIMEYYSAMKKNEIMPFAATWMDLEVIILNEVKSEKDKCHMIPFILWNLKNCINEHIHCTKQK